jgi:hypothetical protein
VIRTEWISLTLPARIADSAQPALFQAFFGGMHHVGVLSPAGPLLVSPAPVTQVAAALAARPDGFPDSLMASVVCAVSLIFSLSFKDCPVLSALACERLSFTQD